MFDDDGWTARAVALGVGVVLLLVGAIVTLVALVGDVSNDQVVTTAGDDTIPTTTSLRLLPPTTSLRLLPPTTLDISITDEPIVIDADGNVIMPAGVSGDAIAVSTTTSPPDDGRNVLGGDSPEDKLMPDVVCMGLQDAQDEIQDHGVFGSKSKDATGKGRRQLWDRNWIVVEQDPAPGAKIGEFDATLYVVKTNEDNDC